MKKLLFVFSLLACATIFCSFTSPDATDTTIMDEDGNVFVFDDGGDCFIHLGEGWALGDDC